MTSRRRFHLEKAISPRPASKRLLDPLLILVTTRRPGPCRPEAVSVYLPVSIVNSKENGTARFYRKFGIFPFAYSDVIGRAVTHGGAGWNRNTFLLLWGKFLFYPPPPTPPAESTPLCLFYIFIAFMLFIHSFISFPVMSSVAWHGRRGGGAWARAGNVGKGRRASVRVVVRGMCKGAAPRLQKKV